MASKRMDLSKRTFLMLSGVSNPLGKVLAVEMCRRFESGSVVMILDNEEEHLQDVKKEILYLGKNIDVICCVIDNWQQTDAVLFRQLLDTALATYEKRQFHLAMILHNEGSGATQKLMEPQNAAEWEAYVKEHLYAVVALNQEFLQSSQLKDMEKLVVNITSSLLVLPLTYSSLKCSCKKARDMYFRAMANFERSNNVHVINYGPGILDTHQPEYDANNNVIDLVDLGVNEKIRELPRVSPLQSTKKLLNILEELSFISGHDVDYYDTYVL